MEDLYILDFGDRVKIGVSKDVLYRVKKLELSSGGRVNRMESFSCKKARKIEFMLHKYFSKYRTVGEYFNINYIDACNIANEYISKYDIENKLKSGYRRYSDYDIINREMTLIYEKIGATYYGHLVILIQNMGTDNSIDYNIIPVSSQTLKTIKKLFKDENIIRKAKLGNIMKYYVNPDISTYGDTYDINLVDIFK